MVVVAADPTVRDAAKALARGVYADAALRPPIDEAMAHVLVGEPPPPGVSDQRADVAAVVRSLPSVNDKRVLARLLYSLGGDLNVQMVLLVTPAEAGPSARVVRVAQRRFSSATLAATRSVDGKRWDWSEALVITRGLLTAPPPGPLSHPKGPSVVDVPDDDAAFYESPWFWAGAGVVLAAGVVVFVLTQTGGNDAQTIRLKGTVAP
ncbi:MAG TPA: hypothetical protein ENK23_08785 [Sorangium sp.]|nr:hypothetical protein [Sorangium sp.]